MTAITKTKGRRFPRTVEELSFYFAACHRAYEKAMKKFDEQDDTVRPHRQSPSSRDRM